MSRDAAGVATVGEVVAHTLLWLGWSLCWTDTGLQAHYEPDGDGWPAAREAARSLLDRHWQEVADYVRQCVVEDHGPDLAPGRVYCLRLPD